MTDVLKKEATVLEKEYRCQPNQTIEKLQTLSKQQ
jgi:hypothetical protein